MNKEDYWHDIIAPEPSLKTEEEKPVEPPKEVKQEPDYEYVVTEEEANEARFDWDQVPQGVIIETEDMSDQQFKNQIGQNLSNFDYNDPAYIDVYSGMLYEGRKDGEDPVKDSVQVNQILDEFLTWLDNETKIIGDDANKNDMVGFEPFFMEAVHEVDNMTSVNPSEKRELSRMIYLLNEYKRTRSMMSKPLRENEIRRLEQLDPSLHKFVTNYNCYVSSERKCQNQSLNHKVEKEVVSIDPETDTTVTVDAEVNSSADVDKTPEPVVEHQPATPTEPPKIIVDETKDLQKAMSILSNYVPQNIDDDTLRTIGGGFITSAENYVKGLNTNFQTKGYAKLRNSIVRARQFLKQGQEMNPSKLHNQIQDVKREINYMINKSLAKPNREKEVQVLNNIETSMEHFDNILKTKNTNNEYAVEEVLKFDKDVENHLKNYEGQLSRNDPQNEKNIAKLRKDLKELVNYELSNIQRNKTSQHINSISNNLSNILERLNKPVENGQIKKSVQDVTNNTLQDLNTLKDPSKKSGLIINADQYNKLAKTFFKPLKEFMDESGRMKFELDYNSFKNEFDTLDGIVNEVPERFEQAPEQNTKKFIWAASPLTKDQNKEEADKAAVKVKYVDGVRYELKEVIPSKPEMADKAEIIAKDLNNNVHEVGQSVLQYLESNDFKQQMENVKNDFYDIYVEANKNSNGKLGDSNLVTRLKQDYIIYKPKLRLLALVHKAAKNQNNNLTKMDKDMFKYVERRLIANLVNNFEGNIFLNSINQLFGESSTRKLNINDDFVKNLRTQALL